MTTYIAPAEPGRTASRRSRPVRLVIGILLALVGLPLLLGGLGLGWAMGTQRDDDGFFSTATERLTTETVALSSEAVKFGESGTDDWWADRGLATVRLSARSSDASTVFIGIAPSADVAHHLGRASYDEIGDLRTDPFDYSLTRVAPAVHTTRRTCASLLVALDVHPRVAMQILRHSQIAMTMNICSEVSSPETRAALKRLGEEFEGR